MQDLISLLNELTTLEKIADAAGIVPQAISTSIEKVLAVLSDDSLSSTAVLSDVSSLIAEVEKTEVVDAVKEYAKQVLTLIENIRGSKSAFTPASVIIHDAPSV